MNKIVCDLCGTSYPETAEQCPICGTAKTDATKAATDTDSGYAYVKGGRFSHANVRKRNAGKKELPRVVAPVKPQKEPKPAKEPAVKETAAPAPKQEKPAPKPRRQAPAAQKQPKEKSRLAAVIPAIIAILLVLAIIAVFVCIVLDRLNGTDPTDPTGTSGTNASTTSSVNSAIPCRGLRLALSEKTFGAVGEVFQITAIPTPEDSTDSVWYESADEQIATVDSKGIVTAVANGQVTIYVHCGEFTAECTITCQGLGVDPTQPTDPTQPSTAPTEPPVELVLNRKEFTLSGYGSVWMLYSGELDPSTITWTSSDETVATVENGKVKAVGNGNCTITAEYMGQVVTCKVACRNVVVSAYELGPNYGFGADYTIYVGGSSLTLYMTEKETGARIDPQELTFTMSKEGVITIDANGKVTAVAPGTVTVTVTYGEHTLKAIFRVYNKNN